MTEKEMKIKRLIAAFIILILFYMTFCQNAYAYLDMGSGSYILHLIISLLVGALFTIKAFWNKIKASFLSILREIKDFYSFFRRIPKSDKTIVFYAEGGDYYPYFEGLIKKLTNGHNRTLCYITSDLNDPILQKSDAGIKTFYLNKLLPFFMAFVNCRIFVMTLTDLNQLHLKRSFNPVHYVYIFHSLVSTHMIYRYGAFDHYDSILCCGPHQVKEIQKHERFNKLPSKRLPETGYYRLERIYEAYRKRSPERPLSAAGKTILVAPSWGAANILESCGEHLIGLLLEAGYKVIARPHPETVRRSPGEITSLASKFDENPDFTLETSVATDDSLLRADVMISDYSGVALEYAFGTERPVLFLDVPAKIRNKKFNELGIEPLEVSLRSEIGAVVSPARLETVPEVISDLISNGTVYKKRIIELRKQYVYAFGHSSEIGARHIMDLIK